MDDDKEIQIQVKKTPAFTVLKNGSILKNIFLLRKPSPSADTPSTNQESNEEILLVGRHPDCNITLEHPSISRYHLRIHSNPSSQFLSVVDLSSVHGTWVSGRKIEPGVPVKLKEGDTVRMGGSSRIYELHWVPLSQAFDVNNPFLPTTFRKQEETKDESCSTLEKHSCDEDLEGSNLSFSNNNCHSSIEKLNTLTCPAPNYLNSSCDETEVEEYLSPSKTGNQNGEMFSTNLVQSPLDSGTISGTEIQSWVDHGTTKEESFSVLNSSRACCDDTETEQLSPRRTGNGNDEIFAILSVQAPVVVPETLSVTEISDSLNNLEDQSNCLRDNTSNGFKLLNDGTIKDDDQFSVPKCSKSICDDTEVEHLSPFKTGNETGEIFNTVSIQTTVVVSESISEIELFDNKTEDLSVAVIDAIKTNKKDVLNQDIAGDNETDMCTETEIVNSHKIDNGSVPVELFVGVNRDEDMSSVDAIKTHTKDVLNQDIAGDNETDMCTENEIVNSHKIDNGSVPVELFDGVNRDVDMSSMADRTGGKEENLGSEFEQMNQTKMTDESDTVVLFDQEIMKKESVFMALLDEADMDQEQTYTPDLSRTKEFDSSLEAMKYAASVPIDLFNSLDGKELELFTPDKENKDPNACLMSSLRKRWKEDVNKQSNHCTMLQEDVSHTVNEGRKDIFDLSDYHDEVLFSSEKDTESRPMKLEESVISINYPQTVQKVSDSSKGGAKKRWTMVLDTNSLLHNESLKYLKLLQGLKGTQLFIPKIVLKELKDIKSQHDLFNITTKKVSLALNWIDECMITTRWWIHMEDEIETEAKVLETALHFCKETEDEKIIILSNDLSLKIKAMAEGIMCEEAEEFFRSLVNPFSDRFMWVGSLARGLTWSCVDDDVLRQKYQGFGLSVSNWLKGLKLLAHITTL